MALPGQKRAHYPAPTDVDEILRSIDREEERQKEALRKFYARNSAPHYSKPIRIEWRRAFRNLALLFIAGLVAALVVWKGITVVIDTIMGALGQ